MCPICLCLLVSITLIRGGKGEIDVLLLKGFLQLSVSPSLIAKYASESNLNLRALRASCRCEMSF